MATHQIDYLKRFYNPAQILTDGADILLTTIDGNGYQYYTMVSRPRPNIIRIRRINKYSTRELKAILSHWTDENWGIDLETFHGVE